MFAYAEKRKDMLKIYYILKVDDSFFRVANKNKNPINYHKKSKHLAIYLASPNFKGLGFIVDLEI